MEGLEVVLVNENKTKDKPIAEAAKKNTDQSAVHVYGHGNPKNMLGKDGWVETPKQFDKMLKADEKWANRKRG